MTDDDLTPVPEATPTALVRRLAALEKECRELKREFSHHKENDFDTLEDRVDGHDRQFDDFKRLLVSHQTTNGLILQSIDRSMRELTEEIRASRRPTIDVTTVTVTPHE